MSLFNSNQKHFVNKPFERLPLKQRAVFVLHLAGFTQREIASLFDELSQATTSRYISKGYKEYKDKNE